MKSLRASSGSSLAVLALSITAALLLPDTLRAQARQPSAATLSPSLVAARTMLDKYKDPIVAVRDGFFSTVGCIEYSSGSTGHGAMDYKPGGMGVHFLNPANIAPKLDPLKPQVLIYEVVGDKLQLAAAEWFVPTEVSKEAPTIFEQTLQGPMEGHEPVLPAALHHWDLHVWLWKSNANGVFSPTNPSIKCPKTGYSFDEKPPKMVKP